MKIKHIKGRQILDSRGQPTVECIVELEGGKYVVASVPSGASVGKYEAKELRDGDPLYFEGKGVLHAIRNLEQVIGPMIIGKKPDVIAMDADMIERDGTSDKSTLGVNSMLAASIAIIRAQALIEGLPLYAFINKLWQFEKPTMPLCMFNIINGGAHAQSGLSFQEFMIMPRANDVRRNIEIAVRFYNALKRALADKQYATAIGDEGGFAPRFTQNGIAREMMALDFLQDVAGHIKEDIVFCLDVAASQFYNAQDKCYKIHDDCYDAERLVTLYENMCAKYPIASIEDGFDEDDWEGWKRLTHQLTGKIQLVGDDIFVTNIKRIEYGITHRVANAVLIKPNQIGTVSETIQAISLCKKSGYKTVVSHRSGETNDSFIADLAVGAAAGQLKTGAPVRGERVAKYNRLLEIAEEL
jgi:enolase